MYTVWPSMAEAREYAVRHGRNYRTAMVQDGYAAWRELPAGPPCWCGQRECFDHSGRCDRCGWNRANARLTQANRASRTYASWPDHARVCRDECEGRPAS